ncbi:phenylacetaldoxime dehydratase family protein [Denitrobaculum tricleocarpae]|uniref:Phenylacetaldoxime dehydratase family protein n=1 Tax=Denitrobaculum tricleocarpae TaxID=2591009 RepID=A0A545TKK7_9PROT|nr:phenylacetaldoxime dehydratase family protein [Denitrobaculum tricleocarpae]TQV77759.1 phenylacetaldoxime dehydratase family protein [Denitrobaculum tricleocarpae]
MSQSSDTAKDKSGRRYPLRMPPGWTPPYPSFMSEFDAARRSASMVVMGCQFEDGDRATAFEFVSRMVLLAEAEGKADHADLSSCEADSAGRAQFVMTGYWLKPDALEHFFESAAFQTLWQRHSAEALPHGIFREVFNVPLERFETLHSDPTHLVGVAHAREEVTDPIDRHAYWGSMRDRIPASADNPFDPSGTIEILEQSANRILLRPGENLAVIRSGQDLGGVHGQEREEYYGEVEPVLNAGMAFLRDQGAEVNCLDCRYMVFVDGSGEKTDHTFGLAYFRSLSDLENWSEHHPTHLAIFNAFLEFAPRYGPAMKSRYWHEVSVLPAQSQIAEYVNCAPGTGLLSGL